jgi:hypothetical protein
MVKFFIVALDYEGTKYHMPGVANDIRTYQYQSILMDAECELHRSMTRDGLIGHLKRLEQEIKRRDMLYFIFLGCGTNMLIKEGIKYNGYNAAVALHDGENFELVYDAEIHSYLDAVKGKVISIFDCSFGNIKKKKTPKGYRKRSIPFVEFKDVPMVQVFEKKKFYKNFIKIYSSRYMKPAYEDDTGGLFSNIIRNDYKQGMAVTTMYMKTILGCRRFQIPRIEYLYKSHKLNKIFEFNEIIRKKSNRRRTKKIAGKLKEHEQREARIWEP